MRATSYEMDELFELWPLARSELIGLAQALDNRKMYITSSQLLMALQLAEYGFNDVVMAHVNAPPEFLKPPKKRPKKKIKKTSYALRESPFRDTAKRPRTP